VKSYKGNVVITSGVVGVTKVTDTLTQTLTAANGDTLTLSCQQTATLNAGVYHGTDQWTVIAGTGRFSDATGSGVPATPTSCSTRTPSPRHPPAPSPTKTRSADLVVPDSTFPGATRRAEERGKLETSAAGLIDGRTNMA